MAIEVKKYYKFGNFQFDALRLHLEHAGETVQIPPKSLETLKVLLERRGEIVRRENLMAEIWAESFVEDANLSVAVSTLRKTLAIYDAEEIFIQTVPRKGYRFVADAEEQIEMQPQPIVILRHAVEELTIQEDAPRKTSVKTVLVAAALMLIIGLTAFAAWEKLGKTNASAISVNPVANEAFLKGDVLLQQRDVCQSIPYLRQAIAENENSARAYSDLAAAMAMCGDAGNESEEAAAAAIRLDPNSSEAFAADGFIKMFRHWDWSGAENSLRRAVALDPSSAKAHHWLGVYLSIRGQLYEAIGEMNRAVELEPDSPLYHADLGQLYFFNHNYAATVAECRKALALDPHFTRAANYLRDVYLTIGGNEKTMDAEIKNLPKLDDALQNFPETEALIKSRNFKAFCRARIEARLASVTRGEVLNPNQRAFQDYDTALDYAVLRDKENALRWLAETINCRDCIRPFDLAYISVDPRFDFLRGDKRFQAILRQMNLINQ